MHSYEMTKNEHGTPMVSFKRGSDGYEGTITPIPESVEAMDYLIKTAHLTAGQAGDALAQLPDC